MTSPTLVSQTIGVLFGSGSIHTLNNVAYRYCEDTWKNGWKRGMEAKLSNPQNPFIGGPQVLINSGIAELTKYDGSKIVISKLTRIRLNELDDNSLVQVTQTIGTKDLIAIKTLDPKSKADVVHPEFVETFAENVANSEAHLKNNLVSAATVLEFVVSFLASADTTSEELADKIEAVLNGNDPELATQITIAVRSSWIGRAVTDGSYKNSNDFRFFRNLEQSAADLDPYVAQPVLKAFVADLRNGAFQVS